MSYTLITVTYGGAVSNSRYETLAMCEQAKSIALTGMTIEENTVADEAFEKAFKENPEFYRSCSSTSYNPNKGEAAVFVRGQFEMKHRHDIKYAKCVIEV